MHKLLGHHFSVSFQENGEGSGKMESSKRKWKPKSRHHLPSQFMFISWANESIITPFRGAVERNLSEREMVQKINHGND